MLDEELGTDDGVLVAVGEQPFPERGFAVGGRRVDPAHPPAASLLRGRRETAPLEPRQQRVEDAVVELRIARQPGAEAGLQLVAVGRPLGQQADDDGLEPRELRHRRTQAAIGCRRRSTIGS